MNDDPGWNHREQPLLVTPEWAIDFLGDKEARVLATPHLILWLEVTARNAVKPYLAKDTSRSGLKSISGISHRRP